MIVAGPLRAARAAFTACAGGQAPIAWKRALRRRVTWLERVRDACGWVAMSYSLTVPRLNEQPLLGTALGSFAGGADSPSESSPAAARRAVARVESRRRRAGTRASAAAGKPEPQSRRRPMGGALASGRERALRALGLPRRAGERVLSRSNEIGDSAAPAPPASGQHRAGRGTIERQASAALLRRELPRRSSAMLRSPRPPAPSTPVDGSTSATPRLARSRADRSWLDRVVRRAERTLDGPPGRRTTPSRLPAATSDDGARTAGAAASGSGDVVDVASRRRVVRARDMSSLVAVGLADAVATPLWGPRSPADLLARWASAPQLDSVAARDDTTLPAARSSRRETSLTMPPGGVPVRDTRASPVAASASSISDHALPVDPTPTIAGVDRVLSAPLIGVAAIESGRRLPPLIPRQVSGHVVPRATVASSLHAVVERPASGDDLDQLASNIKRIIDDEARRHGIDV